MNLYPPKMKALPRTERRAIMKSVQNGKQVSDPADAAMAIAYATKLARLYRWLTILWSLTAVLNLISAATHRSWFHIVTAGLNGVAVGASVFAGWRVKRSVQRNQVLLI